MNNNVTFIDLPLDPDVGPDDLAEDVLAVRNGFKLLMSTFPGTCLIGMYGYGCNLDRFTFDPPDRTLCLLIADEIERSTNMWCADIVLPRTNIQVDIAPEGNGFWITCLLTAPALGTRTSVKFKLESNT